MNVADACFNHFNLARASALTQEQFVHWTRSVGWCVITKNSSEVAYYEPLAKNVVLTFETLLAPLPAGIQDPKNMYLLPPTEDPRLQVCVKRVCVTRRCADQLASFASGMNFTVCDDTLIAAIKRQCDPDGEVARSSFIASISMIILQRYTIEVNETNELLLERAVKLSSESADTQSIRRGLGKLFDSLDHHHTHFVNAALLIGSLGLLSEGSIDSRLRVGLRRRDNV